MSLVPLHLETSYSMRGSNIAIESLLNKALEYGYTSLAICDHKLYGMISFYNACKSNNIKPILGLHIVGSALIGERSNHIFLYAKNQTGYLNLLQLASLYALNQTVLFDELKRYQEGLFIVLDSEQSELSQFHNNSAIEAFDQFIEMTKDLSDFYVSVPMDISFAKHLESSVELIAVDHVLYLNAEDHLIHESLSKIFSTQSEHQYQTSHFRSKEDIKAKFSAYNKALSNLEKLVDSCDVQIDFEQLHLPKYPSAKLSSKIHLEALATAGLEKRLRSRSINDQNKYKKRLKYELSVIDSMGYNDYFLIVYDFVKYAKQKKYLVGPGRGSAAASLVSFCLGITSIDPLKYDLIFERFLNPERITLPDIDIDLPDDKRDEVIEYVRDLYGINKVASICTFGTFKIKSAIRDTARIYQINTMLVNQIVKESESYKSVASMLEESVKIENILRQHPNVKTMLEVAANIENLPRHVSTHAAGIIVGDDVLTNYTALQPGLLDMMQTQYEAKDLEALGLLKIDFLGLRNLSIIKNTCDLIEKGTGKALNMYQVPFDDEATIALLNKADTVGIFQLESDGMTELIKQMDMKSFDDIVTVLALYRPGPMERIPEFLNRRFKREAVDTIDASIEDILLPTQGIIIYQEQIIQIANVFAGYTLGEADLLRRAVSKKKLELLEKERKHFIDKAKQMGRDDKTSEQIYDYIVKFANYGFNKAHSVAYARVSYWMAYLKANYPTYFIGVLMSSVIGSERLLRTYIYEANKLNVKVISPSVNVSGYDFIPVKEGVVYPLLGIKNVGRNTVDSIIEVRNEAPFTSFVNFINRVGKIINKRVIESLILAGACDVFGHTRKAMMDQYQDIISFLDYGAFIDQNEFVVNDSNEYEFRELVELEKSVLGFNLFMHPINQYTELIKRNQLLIPSAIMDKATGSVIRIVGYLSRVRKIKTKKQSNMAFLTIEDEYKQLDAVMFPRTYDENHGVLEVGECYLIKGKIEVRNDQQQLIIDKIHNLAK